MKYWRGLVAGAMAAVMVLTAVPVLKNGTVRASAFEEGVEEVQIAIDETIFPDAVFRQYVLDNIDTTDPKKVLTEDEIAAVEGLDLYGETIQNLKGIEFFTELKSLVCSRTVITELDLSKNAKIEEIHCCYCKSLTSLNVAGCAALTYLDSEDCDAMTTLNVTGCVALKTLTCYFSDALTSLDLSTCVALEHLDCNDCDVLATLNISACVALKYLDCSCCYKLEDLNVSGLVALEHLNCGCCYCLETLNVSDCVALEYLECGNCKSFTELNLNCNPELVYLNCSENKLTSLDVSNCPKLEQLGCYDNKIEKLKVNHNPLLTSLEIDSNPVTEIEIYSSPNILKLLEMVTEPKKYSYKNQYDEEIFYYSYIADLEVGTGTVATCDITCDVDDVFITEAPIYTITVTTDGNGTASASVTSGPEYTEGTLTATPNDGYVFKEWQVVSGNAVIVDPTSATTGFAIGDANTEIKAVFVKMTRYITVSVYGNGKATASLEAAVSGDTVTLTATPDEGYLFQEWQVVSGGVTLADAKSATTTFVVGEANVEIKAIFEAVPVNPDPVKEPSFEDFIERMYVVALNRQSEPEGKAFWMDKVKNEGFTGGRVAIGFLIEAPEFLNRNLSDSDFIDVLYKTFFDREADEGGKAFWMGHLATDMTREQVVRGFIDSTEWCNLCAYYGVKSGAPNAKAEKPSNNALKFATRLYTECLGRDPDADGLLFWALRLTNLESSGYEAAKGFFESKEFENKNVDDTTYVKLLYRTFMGRDYDQSGLEFWLGHLGTDMTRLQVLQGFAQSQEFTNICNEYGIDRGNI